MTKAINWNTSPEVTKHTSYSNIMLEITRKCNLKCSHCMRGDAQNISMSTEMIERILSNVALVKRVSLTGGEPFLEPDLIEHMVDYIINNNLNIMSITSVTNGAAPEDNMIRCIQAFNRFGEWAAGKYNVVNTGLVISNDIYHGTDAEQLLDKYKPYANKYIGISCQQGEDKIYGYTGRAENLDILCRCTWNDCTHSIERDKNNMVLCPIQVSAKGALLLGGNISYDREDEISVGNVMTDCLDDMLREYQGRYNILSCRMVGAVDALVGTIVNGSDIYTDMPQKERFHKISSEINKMFQTVVAHVDEKCSEYSLEDKRRVIKLIMSRESNGEYGKILMSMGEPQVPNDVRKELKSIERKYALDFVLKAFLAFGTALSLDKD